jgi:hypothetical protein
MTEMNGEKREQLEQLKTQVRRQFERNPNAIAVITAQQASMLMKNATAVEFYIDSVPVVGVYEDGVWTLTSGL